MPKIYAMQRANGEIFIDPAKRIAVWAGNETLEISCTHNRELDLFRPIVVEGRLAKRLEKIAERGFWLVEPVTVNGRLTEGRHIDWNELLKIQAQQDAAPDQQNVPKVRATVQEFQFM